MGLFKNKENIIGLDIGGDSIKIVELKKTGSSYQITKFALIPTPKDVVEGDQIKDPLALKNTLRQAIDSLGINNSKVATALSGQNVFIRHITLPHMSNKEIAEAVKFEADSQLPIPSNDAIVDFIKVADVLEDGQKKQEVMLVAARKNVVDEYASIFKDVGLELSVMDVEPLALQRMASQLAKINTSDGAYVIVNIGFSTTNISIYEKNILRFTRSLPLGGLKLTQALMHFYSTSFEEAESTKKLIDLSGDTNEHGLTILLQQKAEVIYPIVENIINEIKRSIEFYQAKHRDVKLNNIYLVGGGGLLKGLDKAIENDLLTKVTVLNPVENISKSPDLGNREKEINDTGAAFAVAVGLALSEVNK